MRIIARLFPLCITTVFLCGCAIKDRQHRIIVSVPDQKMIVLKNGALIGEYAVSTSKFGLGSAEGSRATPLGRHEIAKKIGSGAPLGAVFKDRKRTGEVIPVDAPGRDPIVTRILWLQGREAGNRNSYTRHIYIHGTPEERNIGQPASYGCIRMRSRDVATVFDTVGIGAQVDIVNQHVDEAALASNRQ